MLFQSIQRLSKFSMELNRDLDLPGNIVGPHRHRGDQRLIQKILAQVYRFSIILSPKLAEIGLHIGIYIERALYIRTDNPSMAVEPLHHIVLFSA